MTWCRGRQRSWEISTQSSPQKAQARFGDSQRSAAATWRGLKRCPPNTARPQNWHVPPACVSTGSKPSLRSNFSTFLLLACLFFFRSSFSWTERDNAIATCSDSHRSADSAITSSNCDHSASSRYLATRSKRKNCSKFYPLQDGEVFTKRNNQTKIQANTLSANADLKFRFKSPGISTKLA